ncbi:MAG TPA: dTDP-glucose 4,6-dehydratase [Dissulfurispiraceae bacterium]|nr:dTDP-glucose 4,6-dehydratase [Dissulfurispiraceae bacterium]
MKTIIVTGGAGFIGSNLLTLLVPRYPEYIFVNLDKLTYAANPGSLEAVRHLRNYIFEKGDISDSAAVREIFRKYGPDIVIHLAAESHVDRSIVDPSAFITTNIVGTFNLLEACKEKIKGGGDCLFHHVSTDEVYGSLGETGLFTEETKYDPSSPYSASKASSDHLVMAYHRTYGIPVKTTNCSNNYGPRQFPEKLIPLMILNALDGKPLPVYGKGNNVRDWLYVGDHCEAIWQVIERGRIGETYNIGGNSERRNIEVVQLLCDIISSETERSREELAGLITFVADRPGHDLRYAIDTSKIRRELGWEPKETFETGLAKTVRWYLSNSEWVERIRTGEYRDWIEKNYGGRSVDGQ